MAKVKINPEYAEIVPRLSSEEFAALKADIKANGVLSPILVDESGTILDGHHRYKCDKNAPVRVIEGLSQREKEAFVYRMSNNRRHLSAAQREELRRQEKKWAKSVRKEDPGTWTQQRIAKALGVPRETVRDWLAIHIGETANVNKTKPGAVHKLTKEGQAQVVQLAAKGMAQNEIGDELKVSQPTVSRVLNRYAKSQQREAARSSAAKSGGKVADKRFVCGDFVEVATKHLKDNSVELIFTDPPYFTKNVPDYGRMAQVAARVLVDGGSLITYLGHRLLPKVMDQMTQDGLGFYWICACIHTGQSARMPRTGQIVTWKPILWYVKGSERFNSSSMIEDSVKSTQEKCTHDWQQSIIDASHFIEKLTDKNGLVFDPFCGGGTTAIAAHRLGRNFLTCDIDPKEIGKAKGRFHAECK